MSFLQFPNHIGGTIPRVTFIATLMLTLCCLRGAAVLAQTPDNVLTTQRHIERLVRTGEDVILEDGNPREISADFLAKLLKSYKPPADDPSRGIYIYNAEISGNLNFERMTVPYWLVLEECTFKGDVYFTGSSFQKGLSLSKSTFMGAAIFYQMSIEGELRVNKGQFKKETNFNEIKVSGTLQLYQSKFYGPFTLANSEMNAIECAAEDPEFGHAEFKSYADFYSIIVKRDASFAFTSFDGPVDFSSIDIGKNLDLTKVHFTNKSEEIRFFSMKVGGNAVFNQTEFEGGFDMSRAEIGKNLEFGQTQATNASMPKILFGMKVDTFFYDTTMASPYFFEDVDYRLFNPGSETYERPLALINGSTFRRNSYIRLESYYRGRGMEKEANNVYFAMRSRESKSGWPKYLSNGLLLITVGYGKWPWLALVWSLFFIVIGCIVFFCEDNMVMNKKYEDDYTNKELPQNPSKLGVLLIKLRNPVTSTIHSTFATLKTRITEIFCLLMCSGDKAPDKNTMEPKYNPLWYSIALFLPIVELEDVKIWTPNPKCTWRRLYMRLHVILGYLLIPIGLAAWTGLIK